MAASRAGPRAAGAAALVGLGACGVLALNTPPPAGGLIGRSNWELAAALPVRADFPEAWNYSVRGSVGRATPPSTTPPSPTASPKTDSIIPTVAYTPAGCGELPAALVSPGNRSVGVHVDTTPVTIANAKFAWRDSVAAGDPDADAPDADFTLWASADAPALISEYRSWLDRCGSYRVAVYYPLTRTHVDRFATTAVDEPAAGAALTVTRTFLDNGDDAEPSSYRVSYYPVNGLMLEVSTSMTGADADLVTKLAAGTVAKLRAL